ncbi:WecB/TagA/CpsF family glycosyltransferase [Szabonella alba]|uniref:WecB/TagA/CpsF family glycosyltransferase n=1 Tax=Szabonella alba TaxID=2804194 RepID=UPI003B58B215
MEFTFHDTTLTVTHPDAGALLRAAGARLTAGQGFALATINLDHLVKLRRDAAFCRAYAAQDFVVADGNPVVWLSRLARRPVGLVPGSDLVIPLARLARDAGRPVVLLGSSDAALAGAADHLRAVLPGVTIAASIAPPYGFDPAGDDARAILSRLAEIGPGLCLIALGAPKQERLAALGRVLAPQMGFASIGAGLDFLSGHQMRAPHWARAMAMEWLWRALQSPRRLLPRYAACAAILPGQAMAALRLRRQGPRS